MMYARSDKQRPWHVLSRRLYGSESALGRTRCGRTATRRWELAEREIRPSDGKLCMHCLPPSAVTPPETPEDISATGLLERVMQLVDEWRYENRGERFSGSVYVPRSWYVPIGRSLWNHANGPHPAEGTVMGLPILWRDDVRTVCLSPQGFKPPQSPHQDQRPYG